MGREPVVLDGPFAETKEALLGFYLIDCDSLEEAIDIAQEIGRDEKVVFEIRPVKLFAAARQSSVSDVAWIDPLLRSARPQAVGALLRYFRSISIGPKRRFRKPVCAR